MSESFTSQGTPEPTRAIDNIADLIKRITELTKATEKIKSYNCFWVSHLLKASTRQRADEESKVTRLIDELEAVTSFSNNVYISRRPFGANRFDTPLFTTKTAEEMETVRAVHGASAVMLAKLQIQDAFQGLSAIIERKYAYAVAFKSLYVGLLVTILSAYPGIEDWWKQHFDRSPPASSIVFRDAPLYLLRGNVGPRLAVFPLHFPTNAKGDADGWKEGIEPTDSHKKSLDFLIQSLKGCLESRGKQAVRLEVFGFASSAEFKSKGRVIAESSRLNIETANRRAIAVASYLKQLTDEDALDLEVVIEAHKWEKFDRMMEERPYNDSPDGSSGQRAQEAFDRVVEVRMIRAGSCEPLTRVRN